MSRKQRTRAKDELEVGDAVKVAFGGRQVMGTIIEDRGYIGVRGRRMVRVRISLGPDDEIAFDLPAEELVRAA